MWRNSRRLPIARCLTDGRVRYVLFSLLMLCASVHASDTQRPPEAFSVLIDRQPLDGALQQLARQCGVQMIFFSRVTEGLSAPAIEGNYTLPAAMDQLLAGSGLTFRVINPQTVEVRPQQARATDRSRSPEIPAASQAQQSSNKAARAAPVEEVVVVGLAEQLVATRIATPLREIPQTISIVTGEQMRQRNEFTLADVLAHAPGITMFRGTSLAEDFYARGYRINSFHIDGGAAVNPQLEPTSNQLFLGTPDLIEFDHVEVLRGADGLLSGNADPGGTVSLVRKRPQPHFAVAFSAAAGSWDDRRVEMDITGPLAREGALRGRAAAVYAQDGYFYDIDPHERKKIFGALEYDLTDAATLTTGASYQWDDASGVANGLPFYADGRDARFPRDTTLEFNWTRYRSELAGIYLQYRQQLTPGWAVKFNASRWRTEAEFAYGDFGAQIDPVRNELIEPPDANFSASPNVHTQNTTDVTVTGALDWLGWREEMAIGADFTRIKVRSDGEAYDLEPFGNPGAFDPDDHPDPRLTGTPFARIAGTTALDQYGMFASLRIYFDDARSDSGWSIVGGARLSGDSAKRQVTAQVGPLQYLLSIDTGTDHIVTPYAGLMYAFDRHYSLYASYADIYRAQSALQERAPGKRLGPHRGVNIEAGIKGEWRNGALNGSLALYQTEQSNQPLTVPLSQVDREGSGCCVTGVSNKSRGVDAELNGELMPGWIIGAGYTYNVNESETGGVLSTITPKHLLKAWTNARLPGAFSRWQIGGSLQAQSETTSNPFTFCSRVTRVCTLVVGVQPVYAVLDLRAGFDVDRNWRVALSVNNVLDKTYYESIDTRRVWYGQPRNWMLRIDAKY
jgi:outer-membrane receptor for ferric coprogen and ferric-rhodotorulic acid